MIIVYQIPLRYVKISNTVAICATRIVAILDASQHQAEILMREERKAGRLINSCGRAQAKSTIILDNGAVLSSPMSVSSLLRVIERSNTKQILTKEGRDLKRMTIYDVADEQPREDDNDGDYADISFVDDEIAETD